MMAWFATGTALSLLALAFVQFNATAPHRLRFIVSFLALIAWLAPWGMLGSLLPARPSLDLSLTQSFVFPVVSALPEQFIAPAAGSKLPALIGSVDLLLGLAVIAGALLFVVSCIRYLQLTRRLEAGSRSAAELWAHAPMRDRKHAANRKPYRLRVQTEISGALTTGLFRPTIWIHEDLERHPSLGAALLHEAHHIEQHDNTYLWIITLVERLLWWNPLVRVLAANARRLQELSCDEDCAHSFPEYAAELGQLVLSLSRLGTAGKPWPQVPGIWFRKNFNVERLRALERRYEMKHRHYFSTGLLAIASMLVLGFAAAQNQDSADENTRLVPIRPDEPRSVDEVLEDDPELGPITGFEPGISMEEANETYRSLKLYAALLERQYDEQEDRIISLMAEVESLRTAVEDR